MPESAQASFRLNLSERIQIFAKAKNWNNFKAIFSGRKVTTSDPVIHLLKQKSTASSNSAKSPDKALLDRKAKHFNNGLNKALPSNDKSVWKAEHPGVHPGGDPGSAEKKWALQLVLQGKHTQLDAMLSKIDETTDEGESQYLELRNHLLSCGAMYDWVGADGKKHKGAEVQFRHHSKRFDGPETRKLKELAETKKSDLQQQLESQFSDREDFEALRNDLFNEGYFSQPRVRNQIKSFSMRFDNESVISAKQRLLNNDIDGFKDYVAKRFTTPEAIAGLKENLENNGFLFTEAMTPATQKIDIDQAKPVTHFLDTLHNQKASQTLNSEKQNILQDNSEQAIRDWIAENIPTRDAMEQLAGEASTSKTYSITAKQLIDSAYTKVFEDDLLTPLLNAAQSFGNSKLAEKSRERYTNLLKVAGKSPNRSKPLEALEKQLAEDSEELQDLRQQFSDGLWQPDEDGQLTVLIVPPSVREVEQLIKSLQENKNLDPLAKGVATRWLKVISKPYDS
ncbi:hypothetical protein [Endozoicomonas lisbonensis]|uniref:Uncharacterized protein n=1 Tax=Endozoicomonas lisbonensis TaxID=3120522 RepID=A0ABV2SBZ7_9GAMM